MKITESQIRRIMPKAKSANVTAFVKCFNEHSERFGINTKLRVAAFLSQIAVESVQLNATEENLNYSADGLLKTFPTYFKTRADAEAYARQPQRIANRVYASRMGNGDEQSGDGWLFKGRGLIMTTGKDNYQRYAKSEYCVGDLMKHPEWLAVYPGALKSAMFFWLVNGLNALADREDIRTICKRVNGGWNGLSDRLYYWRQARKVLGV